MALAYTNCCYAMQLKRILEEAQVELKAQLHLGSVSMIRSYVKEKFGVALLPLAVIEEDVRQNELTRIRWRGPEITIQAQLA